MSTAIAKQDTAGLPELAPTPAVAEFDSGDISLPRLYIGGSSSSHVAAGQAAVGQIYSAAGRDDDEPEILYDPKGKAASSDGVVAHVLAVSKCKALWEDGQKQSWNINDPAAPADAWREYEYTFCLPDVDPEIPYRLTITKTGLGQARKINTVLARAAGHGPAYLSAFLLTTKVNKNDQYTWFTPVVSSVKATDAGIAASSKLAGSIGQTQELPMAEVVTLATNDEPEI